MTKKEFVDYLIKSETIKSKDFVQKFASIGCTVCTDSIGNACKRGYIDSSVIREEITTKGEVKRMNPVRYLHFTEKSLIWFERFYERNKESILKGEVINPVIKRIDQNNSYRILVLGRESWEDWSGTFASQEDAENHARKNFRRFDKTFGIFKTDEKTPKPLKIFKGNKL